MRTLVTMPGEASEHGTAYSGTTTSTAGSPKGKRSYVTMWSAFVMTTDCNTMYQYDYLPASRRFNRPAIRTAAAVVGALQCARCVL